LNPRRQGCWYSPMAANTLACKTAPSSDRI
jgi:hypothetical protein